MTIRDTEFVDDRSVAQTDTRARAPLEAVQNHSLPEEILPLVDAYDEIIGDRDRFLWKWAHHLFPEFTLSTVPTEHIDRVQTTKLLGLMFVSVLDDVVEKHQEWATFDEASKLPFDYRPVNDERDGVDWDALAFASDVWDQFSSRLDEGPRATEFDEVVTFDLKQVVNAMEYSYLGNQNPDAITEFEIQTYDAHNMLLFGFADVDLAYAPRFDRADLSALRRVLHRAQRMVRIGNWITTWEREVAEGDFSSGIIAHALEHDVVSIEDLHASRKDGGAHASAAITKAIHDENVEDEFFRQWNEELDAAREFEGACNSVDIEAYLDGMETVMEYHLLTRGLK